MNKRSISLSIFLPLAAILASTGQAAPIVWGPVTTIAGDTDVLTAGTLNYAYAMSGASPTVNGVAFTGSNSLTDLGGNVTLTGWNGGNHTAFNSGSNPYAALTAAYKDQIRGGNYTAGATVASLQLNNLTVGHNYATQIWVNDARGCCAGRTESLSGGANTVTLDYGNTNAEGAVGSYSVGLFNANAATQSFSLQGNASTQFNSVQVRDVTNIGYWTGTAGATWDAGTTANFATNLFSGALATSDFATAKAPLKAVTFADAYWNSGATTAVTQSTVNIAGGGVSTSSVLFQNTSGGVSYTVNSSDANGITGSTLVGITGGGTVTLTGTHSYTGTTSITGTLKLTGAATLGAGAYGAAIFNNGTLSHESSANQVFSGAISGTGAISKTGSGTLTLSGANSYSGGTTIGAGLVVAGNASALGAAANVTTVAAGAALDINGQTLQGYTNNIQISGNGTSPSMGALGNTGALNLNAIRGITLNGDTSIGGDGGRWDIGRIDFNVDPAISVNHITGNGFTLTKVGTSYLGLLTGSTNLAGFVINGGTVAPHENTSFGSGPVTVNNGSIVQPWSTNITLANNFTINSGTLRSDGQNNIYTGTLTVAGPTTLTAATGGNILLNGPVTGAGAITKNGPFSVLISGNNSGYTGTYTNNESNTFFNAAGAANSGAAYVQNTGNMANTTAGVVTHQLGSLSGTGGNLGNNVAGSAVTFSIGALGTSTAFAGNILDSVGGGGTTALTKVGGGKLTLSGTGSSFSGGININAGELAVTGNITGSAVNVNSGGTLSGTGSITTTNQNITLNAGSFLAPGSSPGTLTLNTGSGTLDLSPAVAGSSTGALVWEIDSTPALSDLVTLTGTLNIGSGLLGFDDFNFISGTLTNGSTITLIDSNTPITGTLAGNTGGPVGAGLWGILATADSGTNLVLQVVPEPGSATLGLLALVGLAARRRR